MPARTSRDKRKKWLFVIAVAVLLHVVLFFSVKPSFFSAFKKTISTDDIASTGSGMPPHTIITIPIEVEDSPDENVEQEIDHDAVDESDVPTQTTEAASGSSQSEGKTPGEAVDISNLVGKSPETLPENIGPESVVIPPRAIEITWPDTKKLKHCLGYQVDVQIQVSATGDILRVETDSGSLPADCVEAALQSARRIVFEPGLKNGQRATLWTQVRIEFRRKK